VSGEGFGGPYKLIRHTLFFSNQVLNYQLSQKIKLISRDKFNHLIITFNTLPRS
jgi:hypothetical protein